jgi:hypothetical protein
MLFDIDAIPKPVSPVPATGLPSTSASVQHRTEPMHACAYRPFMQTIVCPTNQEETTCKSTRQPSSAD